MEAGRKRVWWSAAAAATVLVAGTTVYAVSSGGEELDQRARDHALAADRGAAAATRGAAAADQGPEQRPGEPRIRKLPPPSAFVQRIDNPYLPWIPGTRWRYLGGEDGEEHTTVKVLHRTKTIEGIAATVVRDTVRVDGERTEDTIDWYAQDRHGNVWYLGEDTKEFEEGQVVSTEGSWEAGVDGAQAGIVMLGRPREGAQYRQEYYAGHAEDHAKVLERSTQARVPIGHFRHVVITLEANPLEPKVAELKFYARGVGTIRELDLSPDEAGTDLIGLTRP